MAAQQWVTVIVATAALIGVAAGTIQKRLADNRDQWWKRAQWALEKVLCKEESAQVIGYTVLSALASSKRVGKEERKMLFAVTCIELKQYEIDESGIEEIQPGAKEGAAS